jgi:transposase
MTFQNTNKLNITEELLGLSDIRVVSSEMDRKGHIIVRVESTIEKIPCRQCGKATRPHGRSVICRVKHLPICGKPTFIEITPKRGRCEECDGGPTTTQQADWYERNSEYTKAYEKHAVISLIHSTIADVAIKEDLSCDAVQGIIDRHVATEVNWDHIKKIGLLGIDEISLKKGFRDFVTVLTAKTEAEVQMLGVLKGRDKATVAAFLKTMPKRLRRTISAVCTDMYDGFINAAREALGQDIPVIIDRFHVAQLYRKGFVQIRKSELKRLQKALSREEYQRLKPAIAVLCRKNPFPSADEKKLLKRLFKHSPSLKAAHRFTCELTKIYNSHLSVKAAHEQITQWIQAVEASELTCFNTFIKTLKKYQTEIVGYFKNRYSSGFVEGINNKLKVLKRRCYGIWNLNHLFQRAFLDISGYHFFKQNQALEIA